LNGAISSARDGQRRHCLLYVDLDRFKPVNDNAGHAAGDALLKQVAQTIRGSCRSHDVAARIGGDEFAVLLSDCPAEVGQRIADKIVRAVAALAFGWAGRTYRIGASVGMTMVTDQPASPLGFMGEADAACYAAKARGRGVAVAFEEL
jgi:diguanylate cyclase (GGDEF)-like protein